MELNAAGVDELRRMAQHYLADCNFDANIPITRAILAALPKEE